MMNNAPLPSSSTLEVELKLAIAPTDRDRFKRHPVLRPISPHRAVVSDLEAVYFDTDELKLQGRGIALRLRRSGGQWVQTVKTKGSSAAGLHQRNEWEFPRESEQLHFDDLPDPALKPYLEELLQTGQLKPIFKTRFNRWARLLVMPDGSQIELAIDYGVVQSGDQESALSEVELELKSGHPSTLFALALSFYPEVVLSPEIKSKAERGYALFLGTREKPVKAQIPKLDPQLTPRQACALFIHSATEQLQRNLDGAVLGEDSEFIHQARVALRRLRATFGIFRSILSSDHSTDLRNELRWLMSELGSARDWDVFIEETFPALQSSIPGEPGLAWLEATSKKLRTAAHQRAATALTSERTPLILLKLGLLACQLSEPLPETSESEVPATPSNDDLTTFARDILKKRARRAGVNAESLAQWDIEARHAWRITLKKLRYSGDFLAPIFGKKGRTRRWIDALADLQDILGTLNDAATTERLVQELKPRTRPQREISATLRGFTNGMTYVRLQALESARAELEKTPNPWKR